MKIYILYGVMSAIMVAAFFYHGHVQYSKGYNKAISQNVKESRDALSDNAKIWKDVKHENSKITDRVDAASRLGILRPDNLR